MTWGHCDQDRPHAVAQELAEFMEITRRKGIYVILSTWGGDCREYPGKTSEEFLPVWEKTLAFLQERSLLEHVIYVDLDQEFPWFSSQQEKLNELAAASAAANTSLDAMSAAGRRRPQRGLSWNDDQLDFVSNLFNRSLAHFQRLYPAQRFTFSLTGLWDECRLLKLKCFDVLELHCWVHGPRFDNRTGFNDVTKDRGQHDYADYQRRIDATFRSVRPMLLHEMHQRLATAAAWGAELSAPVTTTEAWGPWWHMDHPQLRWDWLREWCRERLSSYKIPQRLQSACRAIWLLGQHPMELQPSLLGQLARHQLVSRSQPGISAYAQGRRRTQHGTLFENRCAVSSRVTAPFGKH